MSRTYRKPKEYYLWRNADEYASYQLGWYIKRNKIRWRIHGAWTEVTPEYVMEEAKERYNSWGRDGGVRGNGSRCKEFSDLCARDLRAQNKHYLARKRWDDEMPPDRKNGKKFIWAVW